MDEIDKAIEELIDAANAAPRRETGDLYDRIARVNIAREKLRSLIREALGQK